MADERARAIWHALGIATGLGSYGWAVSAARSTNGSPLFIGAPGLGFNAPEVLHEVQLTGGNGFHVTGVSLAGLPIVVVGRTDHTAWTLMTAAADNVDTYVETLCAGGTGFSFNGTCTPYDIRLETININGSAPLSLTVRRSLHGPVVGSGSGVRFTRRRIQWQRELEDFEVFLGFMRARNIEQFGAFVEKRLGTSHVLYADNIGNIAFWMAGWIPQRAPGFDPRFPLPGDGTAEWAAERMPIPFSINPERGWLANWNNKPSVDFDVLEGGNFGKISRVLEIATRLEGPSRISTDDMKAIVTDVARVDVVPGTPGRQARLLKPYLLAALDAVPPTHALAPHARSILESWDGSMLADALSSSTLEAGAVIFNKWRTIVLQNTFADELKGSVGQSTLSVLLHVLDDALREGGPCVDDGGSCVPPSRDYFNGADPNVVMSNAFDQALASLGNDPAAWSHQPRPPIVFKHFVVGPIAQIPGSARMTWVQNVILKRPSTEAESILTLGHSGFIELGPAGTAVLDPHFSDQLPLYRNFEYKPMPLYRSWPLSQ
jgi:penicillin amidase